MYNEDIPLMGNRELPCFYLRQEDLPEILQWSVGGSYYLVMKVEMTGLDKNANPDSKLDRTKVEARFQVSSIRALGSEPVDASTLEKQDFNETIAKVKSGEL